MRPSVITGQPWRGMRLLSGQGWNGKSTEASKTGREKRLLQNTRGEADSNQKGDFKGIQEVGNAVASRQVPRGGGKKKAEKKFMDIEAAKEVLTDEEMRQKYDQGG